MNKQNITISLDLDIVLELRDQYPGQISQIINTLLSSYLGVERAKPKKEKQLKKDVDKFTVKLSKAKQAYDAVKTERKKEEDKVEWH